MKKKMPLFLEAQKPSEKVILMNRILPQKNVKLLDCDSKSARPVKYLFISYFTYSN